MLEYLMIGWMIAGCLALMFFVWSGRFRHYEKRLRRESRWREWFTFADLLNAGFPPARTKMLLDMFRKNCWLELRPTIVSAKAGTIRDLLRTKGFCAETVEYYEYRVVTQTLYFEQHRQKVFRFRFLGY